VVLFLGLCSDDMQPGGAALSLLRENKDKFDLVLSDVYMPDMDGFKLLELIGLEMDLPVISKPPRIVLSTT